MIELTKIDNAIDSYHAYMVYIKKNGDKHNVYLGNISKIDNNQFCFQFANEAACWDSDTLMKVAKKLKELNK